MTGIMRRETDGRERSMTATRRATAIGAEPRIHLPLDVAVPSYLSLYEDRCLRDFNPVPSVADSEFNTRVPTKQVVSLNKYHAVRNRSDLPGMLF
jgi:hypothetical protein